MRDDAVELTWTNETDAYGGTDAGLAAYRPAMFYAGALTVASGLMLLAMKLKTEKNIKKKM
jgi:hypothetical protein